MKLAMSHMLTAALLILLANACSESPDNQYTGYIEGEYIYVSAPTGGWLQAAHVAEGDEVAIGDPLFDLDNDQQIAQKDGAEARLAQAGAEFDDLATGARAPELDQLRAQLSEAEARLVQAKSDRDRWMPLVREGNATAARGDEVIAGYEAALARVNAARQALNAAELGGRDARQKAAAFARDAAAASLDEARWRLDERKIKARASGRVELVMFRPGEYVPPASPVLALLPGDRRKVRFFVPQEKIASLSLGSPIIITADGATPIPAKITFIAQEAEFTPPVIYSNSQRARLVFLVEAVLPADAALAPGLPVDVRLLRSTDGGQSDAT